ncbi:RtcB family protein [Candidatus Uabimicrobium amorphum]|uniref:3'-phosphate/5'-hydroxy nucleic acid ligase n=1 Tax=Uabimicrobium amorphum TaxID=2596890 RepID=A0A5S9F760_UABAM|nr:RtcB family protein [Candidatus Uabimicrobium amorphum]BBM87369.1 RNA-splicing ligase RtcB [Candidatus Uabimicrobium amorphum]
MKEKQLLDLGVDPEDIEFAKELVENARAKGLNKKKVNRQLQLAVQKPEANFTNPYFGKLAQKVYQDRRFKERKEPAPWKIWGEDLPEQAVLQMKNACRLPISWRGALMADAHQGYGLPIGGVLATENAVIPYAVGVDIACRVKMTVFDSPAEDVDKNKDFLVDTLQKDTLFGIGKTFSKPHDHEVLQEDWSFSKVTKHIKPRAIKQLGSSGSGNHFVEFGELTVSQDTLGLQAGTYLAVLSHSGSRGAGSAVANHYSQLAMKLRPGLPKELQHLAWLTLDSEEGQEYWQAMELMGRYAAANHEIIHEKIIKSLGATPLLQIENHHNFAWKEVHDGRELIVHRKGATPAGKDDLGIIPGSMVNSCYVVRGKGDETSLSSAPHGAGRVMSRRKAKQLFNWTDVNQMIKSKNVTLLSAGLDEAPSVYKDIDMVMEYSNDLVEILACFQPRIVKMAEDGERPED